MLKTRVKSPSISWILRTEILFPILFVIFVLIKFNIASNCHRICIQHVGIKHQSYLYYNFEITKMGIVKRLQKQSRFQSQTTNNKEMHGRMNEIICMYLFLLHFYPSAVFTGSISKRQNGVYPGLCIFLTPLIIIPNNDDTISILIISSLLCILFFVLQINFL